MITLIVIWLILCFVVAHVAKSRGRDNAMWFAACVIISPLIGLIVLMAMPDLKKIAREEARHAQLLRTLRGEPEPPPPLSLRERIDNRAMEIWDGLTQR